MPAIRLCIAAALAAVLAGCAGQIVRFDGFHDPGAGAAKPAGAFSIAPNADAANPILDQEVLKRLAAALASAGHTVAAAPGAPFVLRYSLGATPPRQETVYATRFASAREIDPAFTTADGRVLHHPGVRSQPLLVPETQTVFDHVLTLQLEEAAPAAGAAPRVVWIGRAATTSGNDDLRATLDALIQASVEHFGQDTGRQLRLNIKPRK